MTQNAIFSPLFVMMLLTLLVWVYLYIRRIYFITSRNLRPQSLADSGKAVQVFPPAVSNPSDNFKNLFEVPVLFYAIALYLFTTQQVDAIYVNAAWIFVVFRALHSLVHCTFNLVILRFYLYLFSTLALWFMAIRAGIAHFGV